MTRFLLINHIQNARQSLKSSRVRSSLTMIGTAIGVASVTAILALGGGASTIISKQINSLGDNIAIIKPGKTDNSLTGISYQIQPNHNYNVSSLTDKDVESIATVKNVRLIAPIMSLSGSIVGDSAAPSGSVIIATTPTLAEISNLKMSHGQFFDSSIISNTAVVGTTLSRNIFGTDSSIGRRLIIHGKPFTVVGVLNKIGEALNFNSIDYDNAVIIDFNDGKIINNGASQIQQIDIQVNSTVDLSEASTAIEQIIKTNHNGENDFSVLPGNKIAQSTNGLFYVIVVITTAIAAISTIVGGIGIMNIMLVTVAERTHEIGIRKALGATNSDIVWQFLIESIMLGLGGGTIGYFGGYLIAFVISRTFFTFTPTINVSIAITAIALSVVVGIIFGLYPAIRASRKNPIQSLQSYN